jgi:cytochrome c oxidase subunit 4
MAARSAILTYIALLALLALTVGTTFLPLGGFNAAINLAAAGTKAVLIGLVFMHLRRSGTLISLAVVALVIWLCFLFGLTMLDVFTR